MVYTICGKTSSGKDSVLRELTKRGYKRIVSYTTRPPREGECHGRDYYFSTEDDIKNPICLKEYTVADGSVWRYWMSKTDIKNAIESNDIYICITDAEGSKELEELGAKIVYILCPFETRFFRYYNREMRNSNPDMNEMVRRLVDDEVKFKDIEEAAKCGAVNAVYNDGVPIKNLVDAMIEKYMA